MKTRVTTATVAAHTGLSRATVTHVLNGRAEALRIRPETRQRVLTAAQELGYRPNASARALQAGRFHNIALVQATTLPYLPSPLLTGIARALAERNLHLSFAQVDDPVMDDAGYLPKVMQELWADGLLINRIVGLPAAFIDAARSQRTPAIFLNVQQEFDCVHPDDRAAGILATEHLLALGHTRIVYVGGETPGREHYSQADRRDGYERAMRAAGLVPEVLHLPPDPMTTSQALVDRRLAALSAYLDAAAPRPTAIVAYELAEALAVIHAAHQRGWRLPDNLSLVMFHADIEPRLCLPVTVVSNAIAQVGQEAVRLIVEKIEAPERRIPARVLAPELIPGGTCAPP
jgi:DNA-binding LacI/PurR family transcriptional regulator